MNVIKIFLIFIFVIVIASWGILFNRNNLLLIYIAIELAFLSINLNFLLFSVYLDDIIGELFSLGILTIVASESSLGLAILVAFYRYSGMILVSYLNTMKG